MDHCALLLGIGLLLALEASADPLTVAFVYVGPVADGGWNYEHNEGRLALEHEFGKVRTERSVHREHRKLGLLLHRRSAQGHGGDLDRRPSDS